MLKQSKYMAFALLSFAGCATGPADEEQVDPGQTSSELGINPGPVNSPAGAAGAPALATILPPTAGHPSIPQTALCTADSDCRVERSTCSACACLALGAVQQMNECYGDKVTCVLDPCADTTARCIAGHCTAESDNAR